MAVKRRAGSELNHCNWDLEEKQEDAGSFTWASEEILKKRIIKIAKRRNPVCTTPSNQNGKRMFVNFMGFGKPKQNSSPSSSMKVLTNSTNRVHPSTTETNLQVSNTLTQEEKLPSQKQHKDEGVEEVQKQMNETHIVALTDTKQ
ncbi:hypothetical protein FQR65_LT02902 [Abscondita terminalis]|nr:hypothetical protein FQR65_LT02902 [Abscondita terminalis]